MSQLGFGAAMHILGGGSPHSSDEYCGKVISNVRITDDALFLTFQDGKKIKIFDDGQSCCESRYMTTDDDISSLVGHTLLRIEGKDGEDRGEGGECHEIRFVEIGTDVGFITIVNHNEHNGYYGGFGLSIDEEK